MLYPQSRLMVFCKAPVEGEVKTRLSSSYKDKAVYGDLIATRIHSYLVLHCLRRIIKKKVVPVQLWCSPDKDHSFFQECKNEFGFELKDQGEGDLGERMSNAYKETLQDNDCAVVVGTDCPMLSASIVEQAFTLLHQKKCSVIGPAEDGGYYLLGLSEDQPEIFKNIPWGSPQVRTETLRKMSGRVHELSELWDVDRPEDLQRLLSESDQLGLRDDFRNYLETVVSAG